MQPFRLFTLIMLLASLSSYAQTAKTITVKAGEDAAKAWSPNGFYRLSQFSKAALFRKTGEIHSNSLFNYNIFSAKIQFINEVGDTLDLINPSLFDSIVIEKSVFYYDNGFLERVATAHPLRVVKKTQIKMRPETIGAYGGSNPTAAVDKISSYTINGNMYSFSVNENMTFRESISLFFMGADGNLKKATKANLMLLLPADKQEKAKLYIKDNKINFEREADLKNLMDIL
jgi:hypothetical protein